MARLTAALVDRYTLECEPGQGGRINGQWRICFRWRDGGAQHVEIVDYC